MDNDGVTPQTYLDRVRRGVEAKYSISQIRQSLPMVVLQCCISNLKSPQQSWMGDCIE